MTRKLSWGAALVAVLTTACGAAVSPVAPDAPAPVEEGVTVKVIPPDLAGGPLGEWRLEAAGFTPGGMIQVTHSRGWSIGTRADRDGKYSEYFSPPIGNNEVVATDRTTGRSGTTTFVVP